MLKTVTLAPKAFMVFRPPGGISEVFATSIQCSTRFNPAIMLHYSYRCFFCETMKFFLWSHKYYDSRLLLLGPGFCAKSRARMFSMKERNLIPGMSGTENIRYSAWRPSCCVGEVRPSAICT